jgi:hypothetical protein
LSVNNWSDVKCSDVEWSDVIYVKRSEVKWSEYGKGLGDRSTMYIRVTVYHIFFIFFWFYFVPLYIYMAVCFVCFCLIW